MTATRRPAARTLGKCLTRMLGRDGTPASLEIVDRSPNPFTSSFATEVVTCRLDDGGTVTLFCKYPRPQRGQLPPSHAAHGHRHGVAYEAQVYRCVLEPLAMGTPRLRGAWEGRRGRTWLVVEHLDNAMRIHSAPEALERGAEWIGRFHARNERRVSECRAMFLSTYTAEYYRGWALRTLAAARPFRRHWPQLDTLADTFELAIEALLAPPLTIVHGEYYPSNVLWRAGSVHPVDWESAAAAAGEIDLASLTEHWPPEFAGRCEAAYRRARWPAGGDVERFALRLAAARLYLALRWAGVRGALKSAGDRHYHLTRAACMLDWFTQALKPAAMTAD